MVKEHLRRSLSDTCMYVYLHYVYIHEYTRVYVYEVKVYMVIYSAREGKKRKKKNSSSYLNPSFYRNYNKMHLLLIPGPRATECGH